MSRTRVIGGVVILSAALVLVGMLGLDRFARSAMEEALGRTFGTEVRVESVDIGLLSGEATVEGVMVSNPDGFDSPHFLSLADTRATAGLPDLVGDTVTIRRVELEGLELYLERDGARTNFGPVLDHLRSSRDGSSSDGRVYRIEELVVKETVARVRLGAGGSEGLEVRVPEIRLEDMGTGEAGAVPISEVARSVLTAALEGVTRRSGGLPGSVVGALRGGLAEMDDLPARLELQAPESGSGGPGEELRERVEEVLPGGG